MHDRNAPTDADAITVGLVAFNRQASGQPASEPFTVIVRDPSSGEVRCGFVYPPG